MTRRGDQGSASLVVLALSGLLALVGTVAAALGGVAVARHRAASAADLAALAAADRAVRGAGPACSAAQRAATAVGAALERCRLDGEVVEVVVKVRPAGALGVWGSAMARSRAGPSGR